MLRIQLLVHLFLLFFVLSSFSFLFPFISVFFLNFNSPFATDRLEDEQIMYIYGCIDVVLDLHACVTVACVVILDVSQEVYN